MSGGWFLLLFYSFVASGTSFVCSMLEATLLSSRLVELVERKNEGDKGAALLLHLKENRIDDALSAILILNTLAHTVGATMAGAQASVVFGDLRIGIVTAVTVFTVSLTIGVLVLSEIIPKTLGTVYASQLLGFAGRTTTALVWMLQPILWVTRRITKLLEPKEEKSGISRRELAAMVAMAAREGVVPAEELRVLSNVLRYHEIQVEDVMTPRTVVRMLPVQTTIGTFLAEDANRTYSRIPLFEDHRDNVVGYVLQREVLAAAARDEPKETPLSRFLRPAIYIPEGQSVGRVLRRLIDEREHMALVTDEYGGISGLVSIEDLVETTLGVEILDESDRVADLRAEAVRLREKRLESLRRFRQDLAAADAEGPAGAPETAARGPRQRAGRPTDES